MPPLGLAMVPCGPGIGCCDTSGRLRVVRKLLAVHCRTLDLDDKSNQHTLFHSFINYFVVMYEIRFALNCWLCAAFRALATYERLPCLGFGSAIRFQRCKCETVMRMIVPRTQFACRYRYACVCLLPAWEGQKYDPLRTTKYG